MVGGRIPSEEPGSVLAIQKLMEAPDVRLERGRGGKSPQRDPVLSCWRGQWPAPEQRRGVWEEDHRGSQRDLKSGNKWAELEASRGLWEDLWVGSLGVGGKEADTPPRCQRTRLRGCACRRSGPWAQKLGQHGRWCDGARGQGSPGTSA